MSSSLLTGIVFGYLLFVLGWTERFGFGAVIPTFRFLSRIMQSRRMKYCLKLISYPLIKSFSIQLPDSVWVSFVAFCHIK